MKLTNEEKELFEAIVEVYKENPLLALSCINKDNIDKFEYYCVKIAKKGDVFLEFNEEFHRFSSNEY